MFVSEGGSLQLSIFGKPHICRSADHATCKLRPELLHDKAGDLVGRVFLPAINRNVQKVEERMADFMERDAQEPTNKRIRRGIAGLPGEARRRLIFRNPGFEIV